MYMISCMVLNRRSNEYTMCVVSYCDDRMRDGNLEAGFTVVHNMKELGIVRTVYTAIHHAKWLVGG